jgi:predicted PurR-regulated permease PerM
MTDLPDVDRPPPARVAPVVLPRWVQLVLLPLAVVGVVMVLQAAGRIVLLFVIAALFALLLNPIVALLRKAGFPRGVAVLVVMLGVVCVVVGTGLLLSNPISDQVSSFQRNVPDLVDDANTTLADLQTWLDDNGIGVQVKEEGQTALQTLGDRVSRGSGELVSFTSDALVILVEASIALILVVVLTVYMLVYGERIGVVVRSVVPPGDGSREDDFPTRIQAAVFGYVRGQILFSLIMGTSAGLVLYVLGALGVFPDGKTYALFFGAWYGFAELIPYVGPAVGAAPPVLIALFSGEPLDALWLTIAFTGLQQVEGHIVAPTVFSQALRINPLLVIFALLLGGQIYGVIGAFIALPIAAIVRETAVYLRRHVRIEAWDLPAVASATAPAGATAAPAATAEGAPDPPPEKHATPERPRCPECGAPRAPDAEACPACGTELGAADEGASAAASAPG